MTLMTSRRGFMKGSAAAAVTLTIGFNGKGALAAGHDGHLTPFIHVTADGRVCAVIKHFEMGQGTTTGLSTLIAEELGVDINAIDFEFAPSDPTRYNNLFFGPFQGTGGSTAMANSFMQYRQAGAAARTVLVEAAAAEWGSAAGDLDIVDGKIVGAGNEAPLTDFVAAAAELTPPEEPALKTPDQFRIIGKEGVRRLDNSGKVTGTATYGMDIQLPNQMVAMVIRSPRHGGVVASVDDSGAQGMPGYIRSAAMPTGTGVVVYAEDTYSAIRARGAILVEWDDSAAETRSSDVIMEGLLEATRGAPEFTATPGTDWEATEAALAAADRVLEHEFTFPLLAHAPMEPMGCTIEPTETGIILHDAAQIPTAPHGALSQILELPFEAIEIRTLFAGGSFGRRATPTVDYHVEAGLAFAMTDRTRPVKLVWTREDDIKGGYYRPAMAHRIRVGLDADGTITAWDHRIAGQSIFKGTAFEDFVVHEGVDHSSVEGVPDTPYAIPGMAVGLTDAAPSTSVNWWRSVGHSHTAYVMESMIDIVAEAVGADPVAFRLAHLSDDTPDQRRMSGVLQLAAEKAGWSDPAPEGITRGVAVHKSFGSYVAEVVEISGDAAEGVSIERVVCAVDCGIAVNPDVVRAQMEGGIGYGVGHVMRGAITLTDGVVDQSNFYDYFALYMRDIKKIETHILPSAEAPSGVGEPGTPPAGPALANAIAATGTRVTHLPMDRHGVAFA